MSALIARSATIYMGCLVGCLLALPLSGQRLPSPLAAGTWIKFSVTEEGLYKINYNQLRASGIDPQSIAPQYIQMYSAGAGMLPQANDAPRANRLREIAIAVAGEEDGVFDRADYILFYGQGPGIKRYHAQKMVYYEPHLYSDKNFYFLTIGAAKGQRVSETPSRSGTYPVIDAYDAATYHEVEEYNRLTSGRKWWGEKLEPGRQLTLSFDMPGAIAADSRLVSSVMAESSEPAAFQLALNGNILIDQNIDAVPASRFGVKGRQRIDTLAVAASAIRAEEATQQVHYRFLAAQAPVSVGYIDFILWMYKRKLAFYPPQTVFQSSESLAHPTSTFRIATPPEQALIWEVTDPFNCRSQAYDRVDGKAVFSTDTDLLKQFVIADIDNLAAPRTEGRVATQNLYANGVVDLLIVTHPLFLEQAERLASHRRSHDRLNVLVATVEQVYNDYSGGKQDPTAIRDLAKGLFGQGLKNILLLGRASYDPKQRIARNTYFVPTYASRNSLDPLKTYASDDYFTFLEPSEGLWEEHNNAPPHTSDVGVGRLPVKTPEEARIAVDKLIAYDTDGRLLGAWRKELVFVADDGDRNLHQQDADALADGIVQKEPLFNAQKIYLDAFKQPTRPGRQTSPQARAALEGALKRGALIVNFTGHGSERIWTQEQLLDEALIDDWHNDRAYPLLLTATCEFGRHDDPHTISSGEKALLKEHGGAIALVTATRPVNALTNAILNRAFYDALLQKTGGQYRDLGAVFRIAKNNSLDRQGVANRNFALLADPSMHLAIPASQVVIASAQTEAGIDTLNALASVVVEGEVLNNGVRDAGFNGQLIAVLKDKTAAQHTLEDPVDSNLPFSYQSRPHILFSGKASVNEGRFRFTFVMPKNTVPEVGLGKWSLYAFSASERSDAAGGAEDVKVGGPQAHAMADHTPPTLKLFLYDTTFVDQGITSPNTTFIALLSDENGINTTNYNGARAPQLFLDGQPIADLSGYYLADEDDFTKGSIAFPIEELSAGKHTIELKAWDVHNNFASSTLTFRVATENRLFIDQFFNYPNPFRQYTQIQFTHNRPGDALQIAITVFDLTGRPAGSVSYNVKAGLHKVELPKWSREDILGNKLKAGTYILRGVVRSLSDGTKDEKNIRLIVLE